MGLFKSTKLFCNVATHADAVANSLMSYMRYDGYEVDGVKYHPVTGISPLKRGICLRLC